MLAQTLQARNFFCDSMLPVRLYCTHRSSGAAWHNHEFTEIAIIMAGLGVYETEFSVEPISAGDVLVMPAGGSHCFRDEVDIEQINVLFQFEKLPVPSRDVCRHPGFTALFRINPEYFHRMRYYPRFRLKERDLSRVRSLLITAYEAQKAKQTGFLLTVYGAFLQLIPILLDNYPVHAADSTARVPERMGDCLEYMQTNFRREIGVDELARKVHMTAASFVRHFKAATGCTPLDFLIRLRLDEAMHLLLDEGVSVAEAAERSGFSDSNYFSRIFRRKTGFSPTEFRRQHPIV